MTVRDVSSAGSSGRRRPGAVEREARAVLRDIDTDHAAAGLLRALAARLAQDVDDASEVRDRVVASKELRAVLGDLDTAVVVPKMPAAPTLPVSAGGDVEGDDDVFEVGAGPSLVVDPAAG